MSPIPTNSRSQEGSKQICQDKDLPLLFSSEKFLPDRIILYIVTNMAIIA